VSSTATLAYCIGEVFAYGSLAKAVSILLQETVSEYATAVVARLRAGNVGPLNDEEVAEINLEAEAEAEVEAELDMVAFEAALDEAIVCDIAGGVIAGGICGVVAAGIFAVLDIAWHSIDKTYMVSHAMFNLSESSYTKFVKPYRDNVAEGEGQVPPILDDEKASKQSLPGAFTPLPPVPVSGHESSEHICDLLLSSVNHSSGKIHWGMFTVKNDNKFMEGLGYLFNLSSPEGYFVSSKYAVHFGLESNESDVKIQRGDFGAKSEYNNMGKTETFISEQIGESMDSCVYQGADNLGHSSDNSYRVVTVLADGSFS